MSGSIGASPDGGLVAMSSLAETINNALLAAGPATEDRLRDVIADFDGMNLSAEERLAAVSTSVASVAWTHHRKHRHVYLDAVKTWALEIAAELQPPPLRLRAPADPHHVGEAAEVLIGGVDGLIDMMNATAVRTQDRLVTELAVVARLLGTYDANTIHLALRVVGDALGQPGFDPSEPISVPLRQSALPIARDAALEHLAPRGCA
jgi:hypothetical protein